MFNFSNNKTEVVEAEPKKLILLIDAENITSRHLENVLAKTQELGELTVKKAYADWSRPAYGAW